MSTSLNQKEIISLFKTGCLCFNKNNYSHAHDAWEIIWKTGELEQKNAIKGFIQLSGAFIQWERGKLDSVKYLLKLALKNISGQKLFHSNFQLEPLIETLKSNISKLENNNLNKLKINIKF